MDKPELRERYFIVFLYEFAGLAALTWAVIVSGGNAFAAIITLALAICVAGGVSGGHINPNVTFAAYLLLENKNASNTKMFLSMITGQMIGALVGCFGAYYTMVGTNGNIPQSWVPVMCSHGYVKAEDALSACDTSSGRDYGMFVYQVIGTGLFILCCMNFVRSNVSPETDLSLIAMFISFAALGQVMISANIGGAGVNFAVVFALHVAANFMVEDQETVDIVNEQIWVHYVGMLVGAALAAVFISGHEVSLLTVKNRAAQKAH